MTAAPPVSVVIPAYNNADYLGATIESVLEQTFPDFELLIADHASGDATWDVASAYVGDERVRLMRTERGGGAQRNWNRVTAEARGDLVKLVCGDDLLYPTCLAEQVAAMRDNPAVSLAAGRRDIRDAHGGLLVSSRGLPRLAGRVAGRDATKATVRAGGNVFGEPACVLMRTEIVRAVGGWSRTEQYLIDVELYLRVLRRGDLWASPSALAAFRVSSTQWSVALAREQARQTIDLFRRLHHDQPELVSRRDLVEGSARAYALAASRRAAYLWWSRRLRAPSTRR